MKWGWVSSPSASGAGAGTCCSLRGVMDLFSSLPGAHLAPALPLSLAGDETRCSCEAGAETLEACEDTRGGKRSWSSSWRSWLPQSASQVAQLTPLPPTPAPVFDLSDRQGALSMLEGGKGLMEAPWGSHGWVHMRHSSFSLLGFSKRDVHLICSPPRPGLRTAFLPDNSLASHQPLEVPVGPGGGGCGGETGPLEVWSSLHGARGWWAGLLWDPKPAGTPSSPCQAKAKPKLPPSPWPPGPPHCWVTLVPVQHCFLAHTGLTGAHMSFRKSSHPPAA